MFLVIVLTLLPMVLTLGDSPTETIRDKAMVMSLVNITLEVKSNRMICPCWSKCNAMQLCTAVSVVPYADGRSGGKCHFTGLEFEEVKTNMVEKTDAVTLRGSLNKNIDNGWLSLLGENDGCSTAGHGVSTADNGVSTAGHGVSTAGHDAYTAGNDVSTADDHTCIVSGIISGTGKMKYLVYGCKKTFEEARKFCCSQDGQLASLSNAEEYATVKQGMTDLQLTGYYYLNIYWNDWVSGWYLWGDWTKLPPKWDEVWKPGEPDNEGVEKCAVWNNQFTLNDCPCDYEGSIICQVKADWYAIETQMLIGNGCPYDQILSRKTYKKFLIVKCQKTFEESKLTCKGHGGELASLSDEEEYRKIKNILDAQYNGLENIWLDVSWQQTNYFWGDNEPLPAQSVRPWLLEKPDSGGSDECARLNYKGNEGYGFDDTGCTRPFNFLCQIDRVGIHG